MQGYFTRKKKKKKERTQTFWASPGCGGKKQAQNTREAWDTTQFLEFVTLHL